MQSQMQMPASASTSNWRPWLDEWLWRSYFRVESEGITNVPADGASLLVANQSCLLPLEAPVLVRCLSKEEGADRSIVVLSQSPGGGLVKKLFGRDLDLRAHGPEAALEELQRGAIVVVFPEGPAAARKTFWERNELRSLGCGGFIRVALEAGAPIVPVAIRGGALAYPVIAKMPRLAHLLGTPTFPLTPFFPWFGPVGLLPFPCRWTIRFGQPMNLRHHTGSSAQDDRLVERLTREVEERLRILLYPPQGQRPFSGGKARR